MKEIKSNFFNSIGIGFIFVNKYIFSLLLFFNIQGYIAGGPTNAGFYFSVTALYIFCSTIIFVTNYFFFYNKIYNFILVSILTTVTFHIFLDISNIPEWRYLRTIFFDISNKYFIFSWYIFPFVVFGIVNLIFFKKNNEIKRFLIILSLFFFIIFIFRFIFFDNPGYQNKHVDYISPNIENNRNVIWIVFDELDYNYVTETKDLKNFKNQINKSVSFEKMYSTSNATISAIPEMLTGFVTENVEVMNQFGRINLVNPNGKKIKFDFKNSIFGKISKKGYSSSMFGVYHPYCFIFKEIKNCTAIENHHKKIKWFDGIKHILFINLIDKFLNDQIYTKNNRDFYQISLIEEHLNYKDNLTYMHFGFPHLPAFYAEKFFKQTPFNEEEAYKLNLKLTDYIIEKIFEQSQKIFKGKTLFLISSDHWYLRFENPRPIIFIAGLIDDKTPFKIKEKKSNYEIQRLIIDFFDGNIEKNEDIKNFFEKSKFIPTRIQQPYSTKDH